MRLGGGGLIGGVLGTSAGIVLLIFSVSHIYVLVANMDTFEG